MHPLTDQFERFRRHGDLDALAAVFDATAPKLLRVAMHVTDDPHEADDLVQQAFLIAIRRAADFDAGQEFEPWLTGILRHLARNASRRRMARSAMEQPVEPTLVDERVRRPEADSESEELRRVLRSHIERLPEPQRQVLLLQLEHGLGPAEIAEVLNVSPGSVRMRLQRGREALRGMLPAGVGVAALVSGRSALAAVRAEVLAAAAGTTGAVGSVGVVSGIGVLAMKKWIVGLAAVVLVAWGLLVFAPFGASASQSGSGSGPVVVAQGVLGREAGAEAAAGTGWSERTEIADSFEAAATSALLTGRAVDEHGVALAGVTVRLYGGWRARTPAARIAKDVHLLRHGPLDWEDPEAVTTGEDGRFVFRIEPPEKLEFELRLTAPGRVAAQLQWERLPLGRVTDAGDLRIELGIQPSGRVVDAHGFVVPEGVVRLVRSAGQSAEAYQESQGYGRIEEDGRFASTTAVLPGMYEVKVSRRAQPLELVRPDGAVLVDATHKDLRIVVAESRTEAPVAIRGVVVGPSGEPVQSARVVAGSDDSRDPRSLPRSETLSAADGTFTLWRRPGSDAAATVISAHRSGYADVATKESLAWGESGVRLQLPPGGDVRLVVRESDRGVPVDFYGVRYEECVPGRASSLEVARVAHGGRHAEGVLDLPLLTPGSYRVEVVVATSLGVTVIGSAEFVASAGQQSVVDVSVELLREQEVLVVDEHGDSVEGATIEVLRANDGGKIDLQRWVLDPDSGTVGGYSATREFSTLTDARGIALVRFAPGADRGLRLPGPRHVPQVVQPLPDVSEQPVRIEVARGVTLRLNLGPRAAIESLWRSSEGDGVEHPLWVALHGRGDVGSLNVPPGFRGHNGIPVSEDGSVLIEGLLPGRWTGQLFWNEFVQAAGREGSPVRRSGTNGCVLFDRLQIDPEGPETLDVDLSDWAKLPIALHLWTGELSCEFNCAAFRLDPATGENFRPLHCAQLGQSLNGWFECSLPAGRWRLVGQWRNGDEWSSLPDTEFQVAAQDVGAPIRQDIHLDLPLARCPLRILDPDGSPVTGLALRRPGPVSLDPGRDRVLPATDADGRTSLHATSGPIHLRAYRAPLRDDAAFEAWRRDHPDADPSLRLIDLGTIELLRGENPERSIHLPPGWRDLPD